MDVFLIQVGAEETRAKGNAPGGTSLERNFPEKLTKMVGSDTKSVWA
ncbi:hypothetical protein [uncultured Alistipes sp.]|nr:hypothetical protein [uncultured Alistipes sp.]